MKIGEAAKRTGLTEKAIRVYVDNGLIQPVVEQTTHRNSYEFTDEHILQLEQISIFRKAGFSIFEISVLRREPERLPELIKSKRESLEMDVEYRQGIRSALERLEVEELGNPTKVAAALRPAVENRKIRQDSGSRRWIFVAVALAVVAVAVFWLLTVGIRTVGGYRPLTVPQVVLGGGMLGMIFSMPALFMAWRYGTCTHRARKMPGQASGRVIGVVEEHGFDGRFARAGSGGAGTREPGIGGTWQIRFMLWNEIRYDCWFPVIEYMADGVRKTGTFCYGAFRNSLQVGDAVTFGWKEKEPWCLYPAEGKWLTKKALVYGIMGLVLLAAGCAMTAWGCAGL